MEITPKISFVVASPEPPTQELGMMTRHKFHAALRDIGNCRDLASVGWETVQNHEGKIIARNVVAVYAQNPIPIPPIQLPDVYSGGHRKIIRTIATLALAKAKDVLPLVDAREDEILIIPMMPCRRRG